MKKIAFLTLILLINFSYSQETDTKKDFKVGLVLSGGGAKGLAHVAAIKVIEEAGVKIDFVGGTSMGAIVGGLYASGYSAQQLDSLINTIDFKTTLLNNIPRKSLPFFDKEEGEIYSLSLPIVDKKVGLPKALSHGQGVLELLTNLTQHVNNIEDFNELPIPFFCIATNLETGKQELLNKGFLPLAIKASSSFPTLLSPVSFNGLLLSDGGIVNNFPIEEMKKMGADIIIGIDTQSYLDSKEDLNSGPKILSQIVGFQMYKANDIKNNNIDIHIKPNVSEYDVVSFDKIDEILKQGDSAAQSKITELKILANKQKKWTPKKENISSFSLKNYKISKIEIEGNKNYTRSYIAGKLNIKNKDKMTYLSLTERINNLYATDNFEMIQYQLKESKEKTILKLNVNENNVTTYLKIGGHYDGLYKTSILLNLTTKHILSKNDILSADIILGDNFRYNVNYFIDNGFYWSFGLKFKHNGFNRNVSFFETTVDKINLNYSDFSNQAYIQTVFSRKFAIGSGIEFKRIKASTETVSDISGVKYNYYNLLGYLKLDTYDKKYFPKNGLKINGNMVYYLASSENDFQPFTQLNANFGLALTFFDKLTFHLTSKGGLTIGDNNYWVTDYVVGGNGENFTNNFTPFPGYDFGELIADSFVNSGLELRYEFMKKNNISFATSFARVEDDIFNGGNLFKNTKTSHKISYGLETFLGPIEFHYTWSPDHNKNYWYFNVGHWF